MESSQDSLKIQIELTQDVLNSISSNDLPIVKVQFWGAKFFKSMATGEPVRLGTTIEAPVMYFLTPERVELIETRSATFKKYTAILLLAMVLLGSLGTLLPTWIFINTAQLVAHLPMLNVSLPATVHSSLLEALSFLKLDWLGLDQGTDNPGTFD